MLIPYTLRSADVSINHPRNLYNGINAHLHSLIQNDPNEDWDGFHTQLITEIARALNAVLPDDYIVDVERSLQLKEYHLDSGLKICRPKPDVVVYQAREPVYAVGAAANRHARCAHPADRRDVGHGQRSLLCGGRHPRIVSRDPARAHRHADRATLADE